MTRMLNLILAASAVKNATNNTFEDERIHEDLGWFKYIHKWFIKPLSYFGSSKILRKAILEAVGDVEGKTVLDVSTGDDGIVLDLAKKADRVIANDIAIASMKPIMAKGQQLGIEFTQNNLLNIRKPRSHKYDVVVCKNTLHHFYTVKQFQKVLVKLSKLGNKVIIMDVENPKLNWLSRLWNAYYVFLLKDQGGFFIDYAQFCRTLQVVFGNRKFETRKVKTIKGTYMLAVIERR